MAPRRGRWSAQDIRTHMRLYAVTDRAWLNGRTLPELVADAIAGGATFIQLREKHATHDEIVALARELMPICHAAGVPFVIDDEVEIAREVVPTASTWAKAIPPAPMRAGCWVTAPSSAFRSRPSRRRALPRRREPTTWAWARLSPPPPSPMPSMSPPKSSRASAERWTSPWWASAGCASRRSTCSRTQV